MTQGVLVFGALGGIGRAIVSQQAAEKKELLLVDAPFAQDMGPVVEQAERQGSPKVHSLQTDINSEPDVAELGRWVREREDSLEGFVYAAGVSGPVSDFRDYPAEEFETVMRVNVYVPFMMMKELAPLLDRGSASSVLLGSTSSVRGRRCLSGYVASKHALLGLARSLALDLSQSSQRVNVVLPGPVHTPMLENLEKQLRETHQAGFGRSTETPPGTPESVANLITFLLSSQSEHIHGQGLVIDGGVTVG